MVELGLAVCPDLWRLLLLAFLFATGVDHLRRVLTVVQVQPEPIRRRLLTVLSQLWDEDAGVGVFGGRRCALDEIVFHGRQLCLSFYPKHG